MVILSSPKRNQTNTHTKKEKTKLLLSIYGYSFFFSIIGHKKSHSHKSIVKIVVKISRKKEIKKMNMKKKKK